MLPETAKALSAPLTKLVEVIAAGCGRVYGPTDIRRTAAAQGDALVMMEEAKVRATDVAVRAAQRLLDVGERRQHNIDAIAYQAEKLLPHKVSPEPVEPDWAARFFAESQDISSEQMQSVWARILAELAGICEWDIPEERINALVGSPPAPFKAQKGIAHSFEGHTFKFRPAP
jgi:hypothetical protein